ncbi:MAG TPA: helicase-related protein [Ktedonosporobacter sp.]|jgi:superfamily II DNA or RNA helicase|nr:helicase-related protein [Ktedonosporobacter sp.]
MQADQLRQHMIIRGPLFSEAVQVMMVAPMGESVQIFGKGLTTGHAYTTILSPAQLATLEALPQKAPFDGDARKYRLGVEALRLGLAYEYDPYFALSIARVDPLPHQLEAVYDYFLAQPRIRFLLADDPGAGKTIMAGLLLKELKIRGLVKRTLIITPANLQFQWQREMKDKFRENFEIIRGDVLRTNYGINPWQEKHQVITSIAWVSRMEDAKESLLRSHWDLVIVDEAHHMSATSPDKKTFAYQLGEALSEMTDHYLLMTATPHKGDPAQFCLFLRLLDQDVYGDVKSLEAAMRLNSAPFYLRRTKESLVTFPDPETGVTKKIFTNRDVRTIDFQITDVEMDFYLQLTNYVEDQSLKASLDSSARGRALGFTMAMLQRRFASSIYAVRRSLERMCERRQKILADPESYRQAQIEKDLPNNYDELPDNEQQEILEKLEGLVASIDPARLRDEIQDLSALIKHAQALEQSEVESKLLKLKTEITARGLFKDPQMKLLIFTEHKDTLDYLVRKIREWGLSVTAIHGGMKIGDRDTPNTRIYAEHEFWQECQVMVATEAAGEGINLQCCWLMINYDIPWVPVRLEQRMGRIHRYGQEKDCLVLNFVSTRTREGRVLEKLFERIAVIEGELDPQRTGQVFNVLGDVFPSNLLEKLIREMYASNQTEESIKRRIVEEVDVARFRKIAFSALEGLARRELNLAALVGKSAEAKERRLVPEVVEDFFLQAAPLVGLQPKEATRQQYALRPHVYRIGRTPRTLWPLGEQLEPRFGKLGREYKQIVFDKKLLEQDPALEWVTPGHPLFECVREETWRQTESQLQRGAVFFDIYSELPYRLDVFSASVRDGRGNVLHRRLFVVQTNLDSAISIRQPTIFLDLVPATGEDVELPDDTALPGRDQLMHTLWEKALAKFQSEISAQRQREIATIERHVQISLEAIINRENQKLISLHEQKEAGSKEPGLEGRIKQLDDHVMGLNMRLEQRLSELQQERHCTIDDTRHYGQAWVLPHPERDAPDFIAMVRDEKIERRAIDEAMRYERSRGWQVESVESENRGFDLISRSPDPLGQQVRFIEVKGRASVGEVALTDNEYKTADRLKGDYWLYVVYNCATTPELHPVNDPTRLDWVPRVRIEHYLAHPESILQFAQDDDG